MGFNLSSSDIYPLPASARNVNHKSPLAHFGFHVDGRAHTNVKRKKGPTFRLYV